MRYRTASSPACVLYQVFASSANCPGAIVASFRPNKAAVMLSWSFLRGNARFLTLGYLLAFASGFGQTFTIAVFGPDLKAAFALSNGQFGALYTVATLTSALCLVQAGGLIDRYRLLPLSLLTTLTLGLGCLAMAGAQHVAVLGFALFLLRFAGQGMMGQLSVTAMARRFTGERGRALSVASLGIPTALATMPVMGAWLATTIGWRSTWLIGGALLAIAIAPALFGLIGRSTRRNGQAAMDAEVVGATEHDWRRIEVLRDARFYLLLPAMLAAPFILTGVVFHQAALIAAQGWSATGFAAGFTAHALTGIAATLLAGPWLDRRGARGLVPLIVLPMALGLACLLLDGGLWLGWLFLAFSGITAGMTPVVAGALWAEMYGVRYLGAIKGTTTALMIAATAAAPGVMGVLLDAGVSLDYQIGVMALYTCLSAALAKLALATPPSRLGVSAR